MASTDTEIQALSSPLRRLTGVRVVQMGSFVPDNIVRNEDLASLGCDEEWIIQRTGIRERRHAPPDMATSDMAIAAARECLERASVASEEVDVVILGTYSPDLPVPASACAVQDALGISGAAFDLHAACAGFVYAMVTGMQFIAAGTSKYVLAIGADTNSRIINPADIKTFPLFGDGAGAALVGAGEPEQGLLAYTLGSDGSGQDLLCRRMGGSRLPNTSQGIADNLHYVHMEGRPIFKWAIRLIAKSVRDVLNKAGKTMDDIDLLVLHQANSRIIDAAAENLGIASEKVFVNLDRLGNTSAASIPLALDEAETEGRIQRGSLVMVCGFGGGLAWGTALMRW